MAFPERVTFKTQILEDDEVMRSPKGDIEVPAALVVSMLGRHAFTIPGSHPEHAYTHTYELEVGIAARLGAFFSSYHIYHGIHQPITTTEFALFVGGFESTTDRGAIRPQSDFSNNYVSGAFDGYGMPGQILGITADGQLLANLVSCGGSSDMASCLTVAGVKNDLIFVAPDEVKFAVAQALPGSAVEITTTVPAVR